MSVTRVFSTIVAACTLQPAVAATWYVKSDATGAGTGLNWESAFTELQAALWRARAGDQVWVAHGRYRPDYDPGTRRYTLNRSGTFRLNSGVILLGGFAGNEPDTFNIDSRDFDANETILSGDLAENDPADLEEGLQCVGGFMDSIACEQYDTDGDGDVDASDLNITDNSRHIVTSNAKPAFIDGFTIRAGYDEFHRGGAGMLNSFFDATIRNCRFVANSTSGSNALGGAVKNVAAEVQVSRCTFISNVATGLYTAGGAMGSSDGSTIVEECLFERNAGDSAGAVSIYRGAATLSDCTFLQNRADPSEGRGGALLTTWMDALQLLRCDFRQNSAFTGGAMQHANFDAVIAHCSFLGNSAYIGGGMSVAFSQARLNGCLFVGNVARDIGGGLFVDDNAQPLLANCTVAANRAGDRGGGIYSTSTGRANLANSILWGNTDTRNGTARGAQILGPMSVSYSCIQGWPEPFPVGMLMQDPLFARAASPGPDGIWDGVDDDYGDLRPAGGSPCIDAGDNEPVLSLGLSEDMDGNPRLADDGSVPDTGLGSAPLVDLGPYEAVGDCNGNGEPDHNEPDGDSDGRIDGCDNCPDLPHPDQADLDDDGLGNVCDADIDGDGVLNELDGCPYDAALTDQDSDSDGVLDCEDGCPQDTAKLEPGSCGCGNPDVDSDGDGALDCTDGCPGDELKLSPGQCGCGLADEDSEGDGVADCVDNCPAAANASQSDMDIDGHGDACDDDRDGDGALNVLDNCPDHANTDQSDADGDDVGDPCDACPATLSGAAVDESGCPSLRPDLDRDGDVDQVDFGLFQQCLAASSSPDDPPHCERANLNGDIAVDSSDFTLFQQCMSGPNVAAKAACLP